MTMKLPTSPGEALAQSHRSAIVVDDQEQARYLLDTIGARAVAVGTGRADPRQPRAWAGGSSEPRGNSADRLRILYRITKAVEAVYGPRVAARFVRSANPELDDQSVLLVLSTSVPDHLLEKQLMAVTRDFLEG